MEIEIAEGTHMSDAIITKQLNDKERVAAALENPSLVQMIQTCLEPSEKELDFE